MIGNTLSVPSSGDPLAALIETELRPLARVLARLIACELRLLLIQPTSLPRPNGDGPPCHVCGRPAQAGRRTCRRCRRLAQGRDKRERDEVEAEAAAARAGARGPRAAELANGERRASVF
jgi:hypothetical protein